MIRRLRVRLTRSCLGLAANDLFSTKLQTLLARFRNRTCPDIARLPDEGEEGCFLLRELPERDACHIATSLDVTIFRTPSRATTRFTCRGRR